MKMRSVQRGKRTLEVEVTNVSQHGLWLLLGDRELFLPFDKFPWFRDAPIAKLICVQLPSPDHLYWPDLDVDLAVESIEHPERFPLVSRGTDRESLARSLSPELGGIIRPARVEARRGKVFSLKQAKEELRSTRSAAKPRRLLSARKKRSPRRG
jgi:hypothetical protein